MSILLTCKEYGKGFYLNLQVHSFFRKTCLLIILYIYASHSVYMPVDHFY